MSNPVRLDLREMLPTIQRAVTERTLQCYPEDRARWCAYSGPCVIGACIPEEVRRDWDSRENFKGPGLIAMFSEGHARCPEDQQEDLINLQVAHDMAVHDHPGRPRLVEFESMVSQLCAKYGIPSL